MATVRDPSVNNIYIDKTNVLDLRHITDGGNQLLTLILKEIDDTQALTALNAQRLNDILLAGKLSARELVLINHHLALASGSTVDVTDIEGLI